MGKVDRKLKREMNFEFPPWDYVPYKNQIEEYFKIIRKLSGEGFNPKANFPPNIVSNADIISIWVVVERFQNYQLKSSPKNEEGSI